jgi:signal transduction histidine kinase/CheY-like chemotaxis protein
LAASETRNERVLILAPTGRDAELAGTTLRGAGLVAETVPNIDALCGGISEGCGAAIITEEALDAASMKCLRDELTRQPAWSDLPLLIFTSRPSAELAVRSFEQLGASANITMIERPVRVKTMISAAQAALRARRRQYEVRDLVGELEHRVRERDHFLAMLSHELRNPLAAIALAVDTLNQGGELSNEHAILVRQTRHLGKLVDDLLDIARITTGKISLHTAMVDVADVVEHCLESMRARAEARRLRVTVHAKVPNAIVRGDAVRLEQVVNNLLSNAVKYTPPGGAIDVTVETDAEDVILRVSDNGKGIAPEMLTRIFDLFMQGDTTIDRTEGGMGVGLTLVKRLVQLHRGTVRAYSLGPGSGSEFVVRLPLATPSAEAVRPREAPKSQVSRRILLIEDNTDIRDLLRLKLRQLGHKVEAAEDGTKGLEKLLASPPEVALIDIGLPGINGYEIARQARALLGNQVYLVALTGYGQVEDKEKALAAGFHVHLTKPADFVDLQNVLAAVPPVARSASSA